MSRAPEAPPGLLVTTEWLARNLGTEGVLVVDIRGKVLPPGSEPRYLAKRADYERAHVPGAVFLDWTRDIVDPSDPVPVQIAKPEAFAAKMNDIGVDDDTLVVAYDDYDHIFAGRLAWALRYYGHESVRILDGGYTLWVSEGRPTTPELPAAAAGRGFHARVRPALRRTRGEIADALNHGDLLLIDARAPEQYSGAVSVADRAGHIPGALNVPYPRLIDPGTKRFLSKSALDAAFAAAGIDVNHLPREVVVYCNSGVSCTVPLTALHLFGREDVAVYDGSWSEWGNHPELPLHTGPKP